MSDFLRYCGDYGWQARDVMAKEETSDCSFSTKAAHQEPASLGVLAIVPSPRKSSFSTSMRNHGIAPSHLLKILREYILGRDLYWHMRTLLRSLAGNLQLITSLLILGATSARSAEPIAVGSTIPDVAVLSASNEPVKLRQLVAAKPAVLIFYRGGWCPYCMRHLAALAEVEDKFVAAGYQLLAISADQPAKLADTPNREKLGYTLLSDNSMEAAKAFGITFEVPAETVAKYKNNYKVDLEAASGRTHHLLPHPSVFIVDTAGTVRFAHVDPDYKKRLTPEQILAAIEDAKK